MPPNLVLFFLHGNAGTLCLWIGLSILILSGMVISEKSLRKNPARELAMIRNFTEKFNSSLDRAGILGELLDDILGYLKLDAGFLWICPPSDVASAFIKFQGLTIEQTETLQGELTADAFLGHNANGAEPIVIESTELPSGMQAAATSLLGNGFNSLALYPVVSAGQIVGSLGLISREQAPDWRTIYEFTSAVTSILGVATANGRLREQTAKLSEDLISLQEFNKIISQGFDLEEIVKRIVIEGKRLVKTSQCHLFLLDERRQNLGVAASTQTQDSSLESICIPLSEASRMSEALLETRVIAAENGSHEEVLERMSCRAAIFAPLLTKDQAIGVLVCGDDRRERKFTPEEVFRAETFARHAAIALENARLFRVVSRSQKEWETTFDAMQDCVSVHDPSGRIVRANVALARRLKTTPQKVVGKLCSELYEPMPQDHNACRHMQALRSEGLVVEEQELSRMGGTFQISVTPWYDKNNRLAGSIHVAKDVTNERLLRQQLVQSEKLSAIGELISGIAHELNNPLTGVMGYSQLLQLRKDIDDRAKESLLKINNLALRCQKIVQNLLSFARKQKPERKLSDINELIERTIELRSYELQVNNIEIVYELDPRLPRTIADSHQVQQVFLNIITNAEQAMLEAHGRGRLIVKTRNDTQNHRIIVELADDGPGIPEAHLNKIFDPFFTTKEVGKGTGLGLSLSYGIIKEHGGNIYAKSKIGEGATFVVELPIISQVIPEEPILTKELLPQALRFENIIRDKRILVVDDERYILDFFSEVFRMYPMRVDTAENGRAAMDKMQATDYDLIVTDYKMPEMSGRELFHWIKSQRPHLAKRIIFVTGDTVSSDTRSFFEQTSNRYLAKPFKIEEVKEVMQQTLESFED